jgi:tRNA dimethylallyltransferase
MEPGNARRIVRALEVIRITGRPFSSFGFGLGEVGEAVLPVRQAGVWLPRATSARRIGRRFCAMRAAGLVDEVGALAASGSLSRTARQAIGYKEVLDHLEGREPSLDAALEIAEARTRRFARRQRMWFRRDPRIRWLGAPDNPCTLLPTLLAIWGA